MIHTGCYCGGFFDHTVVATLFYPTPITSGPCPLMGYHDRANATTVMRAIAVYQTRLSVSDASDSRVFRVPVIAEAFMPTMTLPQALAINGECQILRLIAGSLGNRASEIL